MFKSRCASRHLIQGAVQMSIQRIADGAWVVTRISFQRSFADQRLNFTVAYFNHQAAQPVSSPLSVRPHALGCRRANWRR